MNDIIYQSNFLNFYVYSCGFFIIIFLLGFLIKKYFININDNIYQLNFLKLYVYSYAFIITIILFGFLFSPLIYIIFFMK